jgi:two-component system, NarL family, response regulator NreC
MTTTAPTTNGVQSVAATSEQLSILLAFADFPMLQGAFRAVIERENDLRLAGEIEDSAELVTQIRTIAPDVVVTECEPFGSGSCPGFQTLEEIRGACPDTRIIALDCRCAAEQFSVALKSGANGYLTREATESDVLAAIRGVAAGHTYVSPEIVTRMIDTYVRRAPEAAFEDPYDTLTPREREVMLLAAMGHTNRDIARSLKLSEQTVHSHRASVMEKLGLHDRVELLRYSVRRGILNPSTL